MQWKNIAELVGIVAIVASLIFVALQLKQSQDIATAELRASRQASLVELNNAISDNAEVWTKGNAGEELSRHEQTIYRSLLNSTHYAYWTSFDRTRRFGQETSLELTIADFASFLHDNPGAREEWSNFMEVREERRRLIVPEAQYPANRFITSVRQALATLERHDSDK